MALRNSPGVDRVAAARWARADVRRVYIPIAIMWTAIAFSSWRYVPALALLVLGVLVLAVFLDPLNAALSVVTFSYSPLIALGVPRPLLVAFAVAVTIGTLRGAPIRNLKRHIGLMLILTSFLLYTFATLLFVTDFDAGLRYQLQLFEAYSVVVIALAFIEPNRLRTAAKVIVSVAVAASALGFVHGMFREHMEISQLAVDEAKHQALYGTIKVGERMIWAGLEPNYWAAQLFLPLGLALGMLGAAEVRRSQIAWALAAAVIAAGALGTFSRSALIVLAVTVAGYAVLRISARKVLGTGVVVALAAAVIQFVPSLAERLATIPSDVQERGGSDRLDLWRMALDFGLDSMFLGSGTGGFVAATGFAAHNTFLAVFADFGIIGLSMFVASLAAGIVWLWRERRRADRVGDVGRVRLAEAMLVGLVATAMFAATISAQSPAILWLSVALASILVAGPSRKVGGPNSATRIE